MEQEPSPMNPEQESQQVRPETQEERDARVRAERAKAQREVVTDTQRAGQEIDRGGWSSQEADESTMMSKWQKEGLSMGQIQKKLEEYRATRKEINNNPVASAMEKDERAGD